MIGVYSFFALKLSLDTLPIFDLTLIVHLLRNETCLSCSLEEIRKLSCLDDRSKNGLNEFYGKITFKYNETLKKIIEYSYFFIIL